MSFRKENMPALRTMITARREPVLLRYVHKIGDAYYRAS